MQLQLNKNNLLSLGSEIENSKELNLNIGGLSFSSRDQIMLVEHKKNLKTMNLKNCGNNINVLLLKDTTNTNIKINLDSFEYGLLFFQSFDEETSSHYSFLPKFWISNIESLNQKLEKLGTSVNFENTNNYTTSKQTKQPNLDCPFSFLLAFVITYWKIDLKNHDLRSIKIQIPLLWWFASKADIFDDLVSKLNKQHLFVNIAKLDNTDGMIYQISITDYEILMIFKWFLQNIEEIQTISKYEYSNNLKDKILGFIQQNNIQSDDTVSKNIKNKSLKLLKN